MEDSLKDLKAIERRKKIRKYIRQGLLQVEMADKLQVDVTTISEDVQIIRQENVQRMLANKKLAEEDVHALMDAIAKLNDLENECWKIYDEETSYIGSDGLSKLKPMDAKTRLDALDKIKQIANDRAQLLKLLNPTQITVERLVIADKIFNITIQRIMEIVLQYTPDDKKVELIDKITNAAKEIEGELNGGK